MTLATPKQQSTRTTQSVKEWLYAWLEETTWSEEAYLALADANRLCELSDGKVEVLEMPTPEHQRIVRRLVSSFENRLSEHQAGELLFAPTPVRLWPGKFREPDIIIYLADHLDRIGKSFSGPPDLAVEVLSPRTREADLTTKFREYAQAGVSEYWLVDPEVRGIQVYILVEGVYRALGHFGPGQKVHSSLLPGFEVDVDAILPETKGA